MSLIRHSLGFRHRYFDHDAVSAQLEAWSKAYPAVSKRVSLGRSAQGRELWLLQLGVPPDGLRPALWIDGNMHASELIGTHVCLAFAEDFLALLLDDASTDSSLLNLGAGLRDRLKETLVYVMPRISPDGAEEVIQKAHYVRSSPADSRKAKSAPWWRIGDVDDDGVVRQMKVEDPSGSYVQDPARPGLLLRRTLEDSGPFYSVFAEGHIENFDGLSVPTQSVFSDNQTDLNRNFPFHWEPDHVQGGAGDYPGSSPESKAIMEFAVEHPNIFAWINCHTFGGVFLRPSTWMPDKKMNQQDLGIYKTIEDWVVTHTTYPMVSVHQDFQYTPDSEMKGTLMDFAYAQRGAICYVVELWDLLTRMGVEPKSPFIRRYNELEPKHFQKLYDESLAKEWAIFSDWKPFVHPQLGLIEIGGVTGRYGIWNPPESEIDAICRAQTQVTARVAGLLPKLAVATKVKRERQLVTVSVEVSNLGALPTYGTGESLKASINEEIVAVVQSWGKGLQLCSVAQLSLGHLQGWHESARQELFSFASPSSRGSVCRKTVQFHFGVSLGGEVLPGSEQSKCEDLPEKVLLKVGNCRLGWHEVAVIVS